MKTVGLFVSVMWLAACGGGVKRGAGSHGGGAAQGVAAAAPLGVKPMLGPYDGVAEVCAAIAAESGDDDCWALDDADRADIAEMLGDLEVPRGAVALSAPFRTARFVAIGLDGPECRLIAETETGWYAAPSGFTCAHQDSRSSSAAKVRELVVRDLLPGGAPELLLAWHEEETLSNLDNDGMYAEYLADLQVVCGVGASGRPSCVEPLQVRLTWKSERLEDVTTDPEMAAAVEPGSGAWEVTVEYAPDAIVVSGDLSGMSAEEASSPNAPGRRIGRHAIVFP